MTTVKCFSSIKLSTAGDIYFKEKCISKGSKTLRIINKNPINHSLLNFAIVEGRYKKIGKDTIPLKIQFEDGERTVNVKTKSLAKRLGVSQRDIFHQKQNSTLEDYVNKQIQFREAQIEKDFETRGAKAWNPTVGRHPLHSFSQKFKARVSEIIWVVGTYHTNIFKLIPFFKLSSQSLSKMSEARASRAYRRAIKQVPAYREFLHKNTKSKPKTFDKVPLTNKANYIKPNTLEATLIGGKLPKKGQVDTSTGTTGKPTVWVRSSEERDLNRKIINRIRQEIVGEAIFINAYALGSLSTGMTVHSALVDKNLLISTGPDCEKVLEMIAELGSKGQKIVITGYPSFMSRLIDKATEENINLKNYDLTAIVGGEAISEILRDRLTGVDPKSPGGFKKVISSYGASDLDINIGFETDFSVALRKACLENSALAKELFGEKTGSPMIFQYNPLFYYIESDSNGHLVYTSISGKKVSPRIRYDSNDIGMTLESQDLMKKLKMFNIDLKFPKTNLPFLFVWGREGVSATFYAAKVIPEELEQAIQNSVELNDKVENYSLHTYEDEKGEKRLDFWIELKAGAQVDTSVDNNKKLTEAILNHIRKHNSDFKRMDDIAILNSGLRPVLKLYSFGEGPMANQPSHKKKQYLYEGK